MTEFSIDIHPLKRCTLITLQGRVDSSKAPELEARLKELMAEGVYRFVIDLSQVEFVSSAFLRVLIAASKATRRFNRGDVYLAEVPPRIHDVLDLAGLLPLFKIFDTQTEAVGNW